MRLVFLLSLPRKQLHVKGVANLQRKNYGKGTVPARQRPVKGHAEAGELVVLQQGELRGEEGSRRDDFGRFEGELVSGETPSKTWRQGHVDAQRRTEFARRNPAQQIRDGMFQCDC